MKKRWFIANAILLTLVLGVFTSRSAQDAPASTEPDRARRELAISVLRTINTAEVVEIQTYGSFSKWPMLLARYQKYFDEVIGRNYGRDANVRFTDAPEILPGWSLRLNVHAGGQGYDLLLRDLTDTKCGYAAGTDEDTVIWQSKWTNCGI